MPLDILLLGVQGSGKGTQARQIASDYGLAHIGTGDMLRGAIADGSALGSGYSRSSRAASSFRTT